MLAETIMGRMARPTKGKSSGRRGDADRQILVGRIQRQQNHQEEESDGERDGSAAGADDAEWRRRRRRRLGIAVLVVAAGAAAAAAAPRSPARPTQAAVTDLLWPSGFPILDSPALSSCRLGAVDPLSDLLRRRHGRFRKIVEKKPRRDEKPGGKKASPALLRAPETVLFDPGDGSMLLMTEDARLVRLDAPNRRDAGGRRAAGAQGAEKKGGGGDLSSEDWEATATYLRDLGPGRPLGGAFSSAKGGTAALYVADAVLGLVRIRNYRDPASPIEVVASSVVEEEEEEESADDEEEAIDKEAKKARRTRATSRRRTRRRRFRYVDDVAVGPLTQKVYFTDASESAAPDRTYFREDESDSRPSSWTWDTLYASKVDLLAGKPTGRVYEHDPFTGQTRLLFGGLHFANGISVDPLREEYLVVAETFGPRVLRYWLSGPREGTTDVLAGRNLPGYPDGVDCAVAAHEGSSDSAADEPTERKEKRKWWLRLSRLGRQRRDQGGDAAPAATKTYCYAVMPSSISPVHRLLAGLPLPRLSQWIRALLLLLPRSWAPETAPYAGIARIDMQDLSVSILQDPDGQDSSLLCGVTVRGSRLYLGSVRNDYVGVYDLLAEG